MLRESDEKNAASILALNTGNSLPHAVAHFHEQLASEQLTSKEVIADDQGIRCERRVANPIVQDSPFTQVAIDLNPARRYFRRRFSHRFSLRNHMAELVECLDFQVLHETSERSSWSTGRI